LDFPSEGEQAQDLLQFIELTDFRLERGGEGSPFGEISPGKCRRFGMATPQIHPNTTRDLAWRIVTHGGKMSYGQLSGNTGLFPNAIARNR
jgi:hypothetical protein